MNDLDKTLGIPDDELTERFIKAVEIENEKKRIRGSAIAGFDEQRREAYLEYPDGRRVYA